MAAFPGGASCSPTNAAALVIIIDSSEPSTAYAYFRLQHTSRDLGLVVNRPEPRPLALKLEAQEALFYGALLSPKEKALERRRGHKLFVDLVGGSAPVSRDRGTHSRQRTAEQEHAWRCRALRRYGQVSTRVRGSVPPGR
jgi:hypothetical protein